MKSIILIIALLISSFGVNAQTNEPKIDMEKAKKLITEYMYNNLGDIDSYAPISYDNAEYLKPSIESDTTYLRLNRETNESAEERLDLFNFLYGGEIGRAKVFKDVPTLISMGLLIKSGKSIRADIDKMVVGIVNMILEDNEKVKKYEIEFKEKSPIIGVSLYHKYRAKNKFGGVEIFEYKFNFDLEQTKIIKVDKIEATN